MGPNDQVDDHGREPSVVSCDATAEIGVEVDDTEDADGSETTDWDLNLARTILRNKPPLF